jgi:ribosomal protein L24E
VIVPGTGTLTLPNESETIRTISTKSGTLSMLDGTYAGKEILTTEEDGARVQQQQFMKQRRLHVKRRG